MTAHEVLRALNGLLKEQFPEADFREAYSPESAGRLLRRMTVSGQVGRESTKQGVWNARLDFLVCLPRESAPAEAEELLSRIGALAEERFPEFSSVSRDPAARDRATGLLALPCSLAFAGGGQGADFRVLLGGLEYRVSGWRTAIAQRGEKLLSIGESEPFAVRSGKTEYTVELEGLRTEGLDRLAGFTAELGEPPEIYLGCRWKNLSRAEGKAVFTSYGKKEA